MRIGASRRRTALLRARATDVPALFVRLCYGMLLDSVRDFKLKQWADQFIVLRAATKEDKAMYGKCDPGRIRTYDQLLKRQLRCRCATGPLIHLF
jgi:hypothetical protein